MKTPDLTIAIVNYNTKDLLASCLSNIFALTKDVSFEVIVVDNASRDSSVAMMKQQFPMVKVIANDKNVGFPSAVNQALACSRSRYFLLFNSDAKPLNDAFSAMIRFMDRHPEVGICGPQLYYPSGKPQKSHYPFRYPRARSRWPISPRMVELNKLLQGNPYYVYRPKRKPVVVPDEPRPVQWPRGVCFMIRDKCLEQVGEMDQNIFIYTDEVDYAWRAYKSGWDRYLVPEAKVSHEQGGSTKKYASLMNVIHVQSDYHYFYKHFGLAGWLYIRLGYLVGAFLALTLGVVSAGYRQLRRKRVPQRHFSDFRDLMMLTFLTKKVLPPDAQ